MPTSPGPMLSTLETLWRRLQDHVSELPPIRPTVSPSQRRADHGAARWRREDDGSVGGLVVTVDVLQDGPEAVVAHMLHEAAHILNWQRGVSDVTMRGLYHNGSFLAAAEEVGLVWPDGAERGSRGFVDVALSDVARTRHRDDIVALRAVIPDVLPHMHLPEPSARGRTDRLTLRCQKCSPARSFRISRTVAAQGPILCGVCKTEFIEA